MPRFSGRRTALVASSRRARNGGEAFDLLIGDAAYTPRVYADPDPSAGEDLPRGQASDVPVWRESLRRIRSLRPERVHFCHHTDVVHR